MTARPSPWRTSATAIEANDPFRTDSLAGMPFSANARQPRNLIRSFYVLYVDLFGTGRSQRIHPIGTEVTSTDAIRSI